jgi:hypothetical protein
LRSHQSEELIPGGRTVPGEAKDEGFFVDVQALPLIFSIFC